ncbi:MAG TPA: hypothetical protein VF026_18900 [Ktedonobacteraceae bacterium]
MTRTVLDRQLQDLSEQLLHQQRYEQVQEELIELLTKLRTIPERREDEGSPRRIAYLLLLAQRVARVADYCSSICERTVFIAEGITKETMAQAS